jgi:hypothetical protein
MLASTIATLVIAQTRDAERYNDIISFVWNYTNITSVSVDAFTSINSLSINKIDSRHWLSTFSRRYLLSYYIFSKNEIVLLVFDISRESESTADHIRAYIREGIIIPNG